MAHEMQNIPSHFKHYAGLIKEGDLAAVAEEQSKNDFDFFASISEEQSLIRYAPDKWTIKEVLQHLIDSERVFAYRALALARGERQPLPGFDENLYAQNARADVRSWRDLNNEYELTRKSTLYLIESLNEDELRKTGPVSSYTISVGYMLKVTLGHVQHHINIIKERYLA